jgi:hypothetical protein
VVPTEGTAERAYFEKKIAPINRGRIAIVFKRFALATL